MSSPLAPSPASTFRTLALMACTAFACGCGSAQGVGNASGAGSGGQVDSNSSGGNSSSNTGGASSQQLAGMGGNVDQAGSLNASGGGANEAGSANTSGGSANTSGGSANTSGGSANAAGGANHGGAGGSQSGAGGGSGNKNAAYLIAYSADGNCYAGDDLHASPQVLALMHRAGKQGSFAHMDINDNLEVGCASSPQNGTTHAANVATMAKLYGFDQSLIFDDNTQLTAALTHLTGLINAATAQQRLYILGAGPMEVPWRAINASDQAKRQFVTVISHSGWNDQFSGVGSTHKWKDVMATGVMISHIENQNPKPLAFGPGEDWSWIAGYPDGGPTILKIATGDVSDAGMMYYLLTQAPNLTGTSLPTVADVRKFYGL